MIKKLISIVLICSSTVFAFGQNLNPMQVIENDPDVRVGTLQSGAKYYIRANKKDPQRANFHIVYGVGAVQELDNQNGLAHFLEHMAFNGSKNFPDNSMIDYLTLIGVRFGENLNAYTSQEVTSYKITNVPITRQGIVDTALLILHDWAGFINLNDKDIDEERGVIREEWRQGNSANRRVWEKQSEVRFNNTIYAKRNIIGNEEVLKNFTYQDIKDFYHKWYRPDMQAFIIIGDFDVDQMEAKLKAAMADIKPFDVKTPKDVVVIPDNPKPAIAIIADPELEATQLQFGIRHTPLPEKYKNTIAAYKMNMLSSLVTSIMNERLEEIQLSANAPFLESGGGYINFAEPLDMLIFYAVSKNDGVMQSLESIYTEVLRMQKGGFTQSEIDRAKANLLSEYENRFKNSKDRKNDLFVEIYQSNFLSNTAMPSAEVEFELQKKMLDGISLDQVNQTAQALVTDKNNVVMIAMPKNETTVVPTEEEVLATLEKVKKSDIEIKKEEVITRPLISQDLVGSPVSNVEKGDFETTVWTLKNGIKIYLKKTDFKADEIIMSSSQKGGKSTIASLPTLFSAELYGQYSQMSGVSDFSQTELSKVLAGKNASAILSVGNYSQGIQGKCAPKDLETMMQLAYLKYTSPRFDTNSFESFINLFRSIIPNILKNPDFIAQDSLQQILYGHNPRTPKMSMEMINSITMPEMENAHKALFSNAKDMTFTFVGNFDEANLKPLVEKYIGSLPVGKVDAAIGKYEVNPVKGKVDVTFNTKMETPKVTSQTVYSGSWSGKESDRVGIRAINYILETLYTKSIREEAGGTYGVQVWTVLNTIPNPTFELNMNFNTDLSKIKDLQPIIYKEVNNLATNGPSSENITKTKENFVKKFAEVNNNNSTWVGYIINKVLWGEDNYTNYLKDVDSISIESIKQLAKELYGQDNICTVIQVPAE